MPLGRLIIVTLWALLGLVAIYAAAVRRGDWGMRREAAWEVVAAGYLPVSTALYSEQRMAEYPAALQWLAPVFADVHAVDVRVRRAYWHDREVPEFPEFNDEPKFELVGSASPD